MYHIGVALQVGQRRQNELGQGAKVSGEAFGWFEGAEGDLQRTTRGINSS